MLFQSDTDGFWLRMVSLSHSFQDFVAFERKLNKVCVYHHQQHSFQLKLTIWWNFLGQIKSAWFQRSI